ncbi:MAG: penicillin acylase family protein [Candidatus Nanopelagicales bacterium]
MRPAWRVLGAFGLLLVLLIGAVGLYALHTVRASFPQVSGEVVVPGLSAPVTVIRDGLGVPQVYADSVEDLFMAQGYVHAQDRFWEMDVRRHITSGRLSEMFGASQVTTDSFLRTLGWRRVAEQELELLSDRSRAILDAYARGVNAYLAEREGSRLSLEYAVLGLQNPDYSPEPWQPADSVAWLKALAWDLRGNMEDEIYRAVMSASVGVEQAEALFPPYPYATHRPIVEGGAVVDGVFRADATPAGPVLGATVLGAARPALLAVQAASRLLDAWLGPSGEGIGSNSWVVSGEHTETGLPLLANDPHLAPMMPSVWYQSGLHCTTVTADCDYDVAGWTMAGLPGVFIGHNARIAWGFTNLGPDVTDLVLQQVQGDTYLVDGEQVPMAVRQEVILVAGGDPVTITVRETADGPLISDVAGIDTYAAVGADAPVPAPGSVATREAPPARGDGYGVALRWTALTPRSTFDAVDLLNTAAGWEDFRAAAEVLSVPAQNLVYADIDGTIAYQSPGVIPVREGYDGKWPIPGWDTRYRWTGYIPFEALPNVVNPDDGWIVTANQAVIGPDYPYFLTDDWSYGARSQRIDDLIAAATADGAKVGVATMQALQMDSWNELGAFLAPRLAALPVTEATGPAVDLLRGWDFLQPVDSAPAAFFNAVWRQMVARMFDAAADTELIHSSGGDRFWQVVYSIWDSPDDFWWDDRTQPGVQDRDQTLLASIAGAVAELSAAYGDDPSGWRWGAMHTLLLRNQTLGDSGIGPIEAIFNRGPVETAGGGSIVNATGWTPIDGYEVDWVPSMRQVVDLQDFDRSTWVNLTGASGHAFERHYDDQVEAWRTGQQFPWPFTRPAVDAAAADTLTLLP